MIEVIQVLKSKAKILFTIFFSLFKYLLIGDVYFFKIIRENLSYKKILCRSRNLFIVLSLILN